LPSGYKKDNEDRLRQLSFETPACQDMILGAEELNWRIGSVSGDGSRMIEKKWQEVNQAVCCSDSETVINPLPRYE
jgi:hypothetical protein